ncbi:hypothetical protein GCM10009828_014990 [Actinoplanes couchii]|uniref:SCP domain-containing protein n=1 Tax=Actinoplanes couchii TaxID=403638 RepID=A0ABQ3X3X0_9ACTN|nr:hypothetical protein Aco03nite_016140 [Actinoplanes couchii]
MVIGAAFLAAGLAHGDTGTVEPSAVSAPLPVATTAGAEADLLDAESATESASPSPSATVASPSPSPSPSVTSASPSPKATAKKTATGSSVSRKPAATKTTEAAPVTSGTVSEQVLAHINEARVAEGLKALTLDTNLSKAAAIHNQLMIDGCGLSHQCSGESGLGERFSAQDVSWRTAGENIGFGSSGSSTSAMVGAANGLTDSMLAEVPPNDGHRKNLLNADFTRIGLSIVRDAKGITWMTQDFVG